MSKKKGSPRPAAPSMEPAAPLQVTSVTRWGTRDVRVVFAGRLVSDRRYEEDVLTPAGEATLNRIADATGSCQVVRVSSHTVDLIGQYSNPRVNTVDALRRTLAASHVRVGQGNPRQLVCEGWSTWRGMPGHEVRISTVRGVPDAERVRVDVRLKFSDRRLSRRHVEVLKPVVAQISGMSLLPPTGNVSYPVVQYYTHARSDVKLANEVGQVLETLGSHLTA